MQIECRVIDDKFLIQFESEYIYEHFLNDMIFVHDMAKEQGYDFIALEMIIDVLKNSEDKLNIIIPPEKEKGVLGAIVEFVFFTKILIKNFSKTKEQLHLAEELLDLNEKMVISLTKKIKKYEKES